MDHLEDLGQDGRRVFKRVSKRKVGGRGVVCSGAG